MASRPPAGLAAGVLPGPEDAARRDGGKVGVLLQDERLRWLDTFAEGPDGAIYVTASHIMDMPWYKPGKPAAVPTALFRFDAPR